MNIVINYVGAMGYPNGKNKDSHTSELRKIRNQSMQSKLLEKNTMKLYVLEHEIGTNFFPCH
jgi:hypothetical protein